MQRGKNVINYIYADSFFSERVTDKWNSLQTVYNRLKEYQLLQEWTGTYTMCYMDGFRELLVHLALWPHMLYGSVFSASGAAPE